jgi:hypothetical protein
MNSTSPQLSVLSAEQLAARHLTLGEPKQPAGIDAEQVKRKLGEKYGVSDFTDVVLAQVVDPMQSPAFDRTCWVVSVPGHPRSGQRGGASMPGAFEVWFVDSQTGELLFGMQEFGF